MNLVFRNKKSGPLTTPTRQLKYPATVQPQTSEAEALEGLRPRALEGLSPRGLESLGPRDPEGLEGPRPRRPRAARGRRKPGKKPSPLSRFFFFRTVFAFYLKRGYPPLGPLPPVAAPPRFLKNFRFLLEAKVAPPGPPFLERTPSLSQFPGLPGATPKKPEKPLSPRGTWSRGAGLGAEPLNL